MNKSSAILALTLIIITTGCGTNKYTTRMHSQIKKHKLEKEEVVVLVDYKDSWLSNRFFIVNPTQKTIIFQAKTGHAYKTGAFYATEFSNVPNSKKSSLGLYKIGRQYVGKFGKSLKLHGLSKTNSNVYKRFIVLHGCNCTHSIGCIVLDHEFMPRILKVLKKGTRMVVYK